MVKRSCEAERYRSDPNWRSSIVDAQNLKPAPTLAKHARTPFPGESAEYRKAREALVAEEIEFRRHMTRLTQQRRALPPGPVIEKDYRFRDANGKRSARRLCFKSQPLHRTLR